MPPHAVGESVSVRTGLVRGAGCNLDRVCERAQRTAVTWTWLLFSRRVRTCRNAQLPFERLANGGDAFQNDCHWMPTLVPCAVGASPSAR
jgi:hypothetical protein